MGVSAAAITKGIREGRIDASDDSKQVDLCKKRSRDFVATKLGPRKAPAFLREYGAEFERGDDDKPSITEKQSKKPAKSKKREPSVSYSEESEDIEAEVTSGTDSLSKTEADIRRIKAQTAKLNMEMAKEAKRLILREKVSVFFAQLATTVTNLVLPMGQRLAQDICDKLEVNDPEKIIVVQNMIDAENERVINEYKRVAEDADKW